MHELNAIQQNTYIHSPDWHVTICICMHMCMYIDSNAATLPLSLLVSPVTAPIIYAKEEIDYNDVGELTPVSEDEDI